MDNNSYTSKNSIKKSRKIRFQKYCSCGGKQKGFFKRKCEVCGKVECSKLVQLLVNIFGRIGRIPKKVAVSIKQSAKAQKIFFAATISIVALYLGFLNYGIIRHFFYSLVLALIFVETVISSRISSYLNSTKKQEKTRKKRSAESVVVYVLVVLLPFIISVIEILQSEIYLYWILILFSLVSWIIFHKVYDVYIDKYAIFLITAEAVEFLLSIYKLLELV